MRQAGRVSIVGLVGAVCAVSLVVLLLFSRESLNTVGARFMTALAKSDVKTLTEMSYIDGKSAADIQKMWEFTTKVGRNYSFRWRIVSATQAGEDSASVRMQVERDIIKGTGYEQPYELPLIRHEGRWKVDVAAISREMYPALPR